MLHRQVPMSPARRRPRASRSSVGRQVKKQVFPGQFRQSTSANVMTDGQVGGSSVSRSVEKPFGEYPGPEQGG